MFKSITLAAIWLRLPLAHRRLITPVAFCTLLILLLNITQCQTESALPAQRLVVGQRYPVTPAQMIVRQAPVQSVTEQQLHLPIQAGDNLAKLLSAHGVSASDIYYLSRSDHAQPLLNLQVGTQLILTLNNDRQWTQLSYWSNASEIHRYNKLGDKQYEYEHILIPQDIGQYFHYGEIHSSFWQAGIDAGMSENQIMQLADLFGWDIDFATELRSGDSFNVYFENIYQHGQLVSQGRILAAEFINQNERFVAIYNPEDGQYYTPEGRSMRKSFLRSPVNFRYISSNFTKQRYHPVQKRWKQHRGTDYAADIGTPVVAAGDGKVIEAGYNRFNGHYVFIQHNDRYVTKYLHFSKRKVRQGQSVKQGQVIGLVGKTGLASGPHLHYEFIVDGVHRNPRTVKLPQAQPLSHQAMLGFAPKVQTALAQLAWQRQFMQGTQTDKE